MTDPAGGIFNFEQMNVIRDAHRDWCAEHSIDVKSPAGQQMATMMFEAFQAGKTSRDELIAICDDHWQLREDNVRLGAPPVESKP